MWTLVLKNGIRVSSVIGKVLAALACQGLYTLDKFAPLPCVDLCFPGAEGTKGEGEPVLHKVQVARLSRGAERERAADRGNSGERFRS